MASMFATEVTSSTFLGASMPKTAAVACKARVTMSFSKEELQRKPLSLIRTLARQRGIPISTKPQMITSLLGSTPTYTSTPSRSSSSASSANDGEYASKTLGELRALAKARGLRGDTRAEIISLLKSSPAPAAVESYSSSSSFSAPSYPAAETPKGLPKAVLERKSLAELRAMARVRGLRGDTKAELVKLLSESTGSQEVSAAPSYSAPSYSSSSNGSYTAPSNGASTSNASAVRQLSLKSLSQLRAMAAVRGIRGSTKHELVRQLALVA